MRGIHKPSKLRAALAVLTVAPKEGAPAPYDDCFDVHGSFRYHYRDPGTEGGSCAPYGRLGQSVIACRDGPLTSNYLLHRYHSRAIPTNISYVCC
jgi:hypothetical protein